MAPFEGFAGTSDWEETQNMPERLYISCGLGMPQEELEILLGRWMSGLPCVVCCHGNPAENGWMDFPCSLSKFTEINQTV